MKVIWVGSGCVVRGAEIRVRDKGQMILASISFLQEFGYFC